MTWVWVDHPSRTWYCRRRAMGAKHWHRIQARIQIRHVSGELQTSRRLTLRTQHWHRRNSEPRPKISQPPKGAHSSSSRTPSLSTTFTLYFPGETTRRLDTSSMHRRSVAKPSSRLASGSWYLRNMIEQLVKVETMMARGKTSRSLSGTTPALGTTARESCESKRKFITDAWYVGHECSRCTRGGSAFH